MASNEELAAEVERLKAQVESYRQREFESLRARLLAALEDVESWRQEANRLSLAALEVERVLREEIDTLRAQLNSATGRDSAWSNVNRITAERMTKAAASN